MTEASERGSHGGSHIDDTQSDTVEPVEPVEKILRTPRRRRAGQKYERAKCTVLPALATIDPLLNLLGEPTNWEDGRGPGFNMDSPEANPRLPKLSTDVPKEGSAAWLSRLFPGRSSNGGEGVPIPSDEEFKEWLTLPRVMASSRCRKGEGDFCDGSTVWHVVLLRKTFQAEQNTPEHVADCLVEVLGIEPELAEKLVEEAASRQMACLVSYEDQRGAFQKMEGLRARGLLVQVVSKAGLPGGNASPPRTHGRSRGCSASYSELFDHVLQGTESRGGRANVATAGRLQAPTSGHPRPSEGWFHGHSEEEIWVLPEDAVEALFASEQDPFLSEIRGEVAKKRPNFSPNRDRKQSVPKSENADARPTADARPAGDGRANDARPDANSSPNAHARSKKGVPLLRTTVKSRVVPVNAFRSAARHSEHEAAAGTPAVEAQKEGDDAQTAPQKLSPIRKEACQMLRIFIFGRIGNEQAACAREREQVFQEAIGSKEQVKILYNLWQKLDEDNSGRVDLGEFRTYVEKNIKDRMLQLGVDMSQLGVRQNGGTVAEDAPKFISKLCDKLSQALLGKKSSFAIEDMMRLVWPCANAVDMKVMKQWCKEHAVACAKTRVRTPPILDPADLEGLRSVFQHFDEDRSGEVTFEELTMKGLIYEDQVEAFVREWDRNGDGALDITEFCEMMCPIGWRASVESKIGSQKDGTRVVFDANSGGWHALEEE
mmetsp:Transcript_9213/g.20436  ORF Transcript_9213/g.20436 Transcript_9213/m.20436 type:complete len:715 (-) Transcript_9213:102-2246(-)